jgi:hypothetical protein
VDFSVLVIYFVPLRVLRVPRFLFVQCMSFLVALVPGPSVPTKLEVTGRSLCYSAPSAWLGLLRALHAQRMIAHHLGAQLVGCLGPHSPKATVTVTVA